MQELEEKAKASEGYRIYTKIRALQGSYHVFEGNYHNLVWALEEFRKSDVIDELWRVDNREGPDGFLREIARIFHNYLSGAKTLVDHTRVFKGEMYSGTSFEIEYQNRVNKDLKDSPIVQFVQNLRNYTLHKSLPIAAAELNLTISDTGTGIEIDTTVKLDVNELRDWNGWTKKSREYLDMLSGRVELREVAEQYKPAIEAFYDWFGKRQSELHRDEFKELEELEAKVRWAEQRWRESRGGTASNG